LQNAADIAENRIVPNPNSPVSEFAHRCIALGVCGTFGVVAAIDFDHETPLAADEVREIRSDRLLTHKLETGELPIAKMSPEHKFSARAPPA
jgi:hypothetical protein